ncbi:MAG: hypothetical protein ABSA47_02165 [Verrucomicrobiota bacterium]
MRKVHYWLKTGAALVLWVAIALGHRVYAQAPATNYVFPWTNRAAPFDIYGLRTPPTPFDSSIVDRPGVKLPEQGPWTVSVGDFNYPILFIVDLVEHNHPPFPFLWDSLSSETRSALEKEYREIKVFFGDDDPGFWSVSELEKVRVEMKIPGGHYAPGPGLKDLAANLNQLIQGKLIYDEKSFAPIKPYLSGDTVTLLHQPAGAFVSRLNRLLLEDAFPLDIKRRPKILFDAADQNYFFIDFTKKTISLYGKDGKKKWTADLGPTIAKIAKDWGGLLGMLRVDGRDTSIIPVTHNNLGIFDVSLQPRYPGLLLVEFEGVQYGVIQLSTGRVANLSTGGGVPRHFN